MGTAFLTEGFLAVTRGWGCCHTEEKEGEYKWKHFSE